MTVSPIYFVTKLWIFIFTALYKVFEGGYYILISDRTGWVLAFGTVGSRVLMLSQSLILSVSYSVQHCKKNMFKKYKLRKKRMTLQIIYSFFRQKESQADN